MRNNAKTVVYGGSLDETPHDLVPAANQSVPKGFKRGGRVHKTGFAKVHRGEYVLTAKQAKGHSKKKGTRKRVATKR